MILHHEITREVNIAKLLTQGKKIKECSPGINIYGLTNPPEGLN
jgi:hypothetical protein